MNLRHSIRARMSLAFTLLGLLVLTLGLFSVQRLSEVNAASAEIRDRWLQSSQLLGELANVTSDYRAAEASHLLAASPDEMAASQQELDTLNQAIAQAWRRYEKLPHDAAESSLWKQFGQQWARYREVADRVVALSARMRKAEGVALYRGESRQTYDPASDTLDLLTARTVGSARDASNRAEHIFRQARVLIFVAIVLASVLSVSVMAYITRTISVPILELAAAMRKLAASKTNIEIRGITRNDEVGEMARAVVVFRNNAIELAHSHRGLEQQAAMMAEKLEHEQRLTTLQRNFVSMASHEFRTPLTVIDAQAQRLIKTRSAVAADEIGERAGKIRNAIRRMTNLIETLINSSRLFEADAGLYFHPSEIDPGALLREVCQMHREISADARINEHLSRLPASMQADAKLLYQAISNLLSNAIKYSPNGDPVCLSATTGAGQLVVTVQDDGIGIPPADLDHVFERYHRGGNVRGTVGTGIGLYLVKAVAMLHGGTVSVESREGRGSKFTLSLPLSLAQPAGLEDAPEPVREQA
jgi:two-component system, OmpR family, sensor kinase